jgi:hypothetical protein
MRDCFRFKKRGQLFFRSYNETFPIIAVRVNNPDVCPLGSIADTQPRLHPDALRLSAMRFTICRSSQ